MEEVAQDNTKRWLKPQEIMQRRRAAKYNSKSEPRKRRPFNDSTTETLNRKSAKRVNPFSITHSPDRLKIDEKTSVDRTDTNVLERLEIDAEKVKEWEVDVEGEGGGGSEERWCGCCPTDWSLKTRVRVISEHSLAWCSCMKTSHEADGLCNFVQCTGDGLEDCQPAFKRCLLQWVHPCLPWLELYPRKHLLTNELDPQCYTALQKEWRESFRSIYHMLRSDRCPFFYLCAAQFTVVFRAKGMGGRAAVHALLTPSTKGIRDALDSESVQYSMPFISQTNKSSSNVIAETTDSPTTASCNTNSDSCTSTAPDKEREGDNVDSYSSSGGESIEPHDWLESMGLDMADFPTLDPNQIALQKLQVGHTDDRPESMLLISGLLNVQALFNYLLNSTTIIPVVGAHTGIPPTILSPRPFEGATLKCLKARYSVIQVAEGIDTQRECRKMQPFHCVDIAGPLLPHQLVQLCQLLDTTQDGDYRISLITHKQTVAFNCSVGSDGNVELTESDAVRSGMSLKTLQLLSRRGEEKMNGICARNISCKEHLYRWA